MALEALSLQNNRIHWVDSAKGLGVILIIVGHLAYSSSISWIVHLIYSFHIPLFFMLAGTTYKRPSNRIISFLRGKNKRLLIPFLCYTLIGLPFEYEELKGESLKTIIYGMFYIKSEIIYNLPLWFLVVLFLVYCIAAISRADNDNTICTSIYALFAFVVGWLFYVINDDVSVFNILGINRVIICFAFFIIGKTIARINPSVPLAVISGILCIGIALMNEKVSVYSYELGSYWLFVISGLSGSIAIIQLTKLLFDKPILLGYFSKYGILFLGTQYLWIMPFRNLCKEFCIEKVFPTYDVVALVLMLIYVLATPLIYNLLSKKAKVLRVLNGEYS